MVITYLYNHKEDTHEYEEGHIVLVKAGGAHFHTTFTPYKIPTDVTFIFIRKKKWCST